MYHCLISLKSATQLLHWDRGRPARTERSEKTVTTPITSEHHLDPWLSEDHPSLTETLHLVETIPQTESLSAFQPHCYPLLMGLFQDFDPNELRAAGWHTRGYLPHFDGVAKPQFITLHLGDSIPPRVIERWKRELRGLPYEQERILLQKRIEKYLDMGYGSASLKQPEIAKDGPGLIVEV